MWAAESRRDAENRVYDSAAEFAFVAQRLRMELTRPESRRVLAPVLGCIHEAVESLTAALRDIAVAARRDDRRAADLESCVTLLEAVADHCERARRVAASSPSRVRAAPP